jgi:fumarate reductase flavoprotein subunit
MSRIKPVSGVALDAQVPLLIIGAGAAGLCAALAAKEAGAEPLVIERDAVPAGSTSLSAGLIPAAGTRFQRARGIADSPQLFAADIQRKAKGEVDAAVVDAVAQGAGPLIEWLADRHGLPFDVIDNFNYPGHTALRMHGLPTRTDRS